MYQYQKEKEKIFTEDGMEALMSVKEYIKIALENSGSVRMDKIIRNSRACYTWLTMACVDYLVEKGEIKEITDSKNSYVPGQYRIFVSNSE